jgi:hypothetical protein
MITLIAHEPPGQFPASPGFFLQMMSLTPTSDPWGPSPGRAVRPGKSEGSSRGRADLASDDRIVIVAEETGQSEAGPSALGPLSERGGRV